jgi:tetratricopeptide (TPR) repeat protein
MRATQEEQNQDVKTWLSIIESTCPFPELCNYDRSLEVMTQRAHYEWLNPETDDSEHGTQKFAFALAVYRAGQPERALLAMRREFTEKAGIFKETDRLLWRCRILLSLGRLDEAQQEFEAAQAQPADIAADIDRGGAAAFLIRKRLFRECCEILAGYDSSEAPPQPHVHLSNVPISPDQIRRDLDRAVELRPRELMSWRNRAEFRLKTGDTRGALSDFEAYIKTATEVDPGSATDAYLIVRQAMCHDLLGEFEEGTKDYEKAAALDQNDDWTREVCMRQLFGLAEKLWKLGHQDEARHAWGAVVERTRISFDAIPSEIVRFDLGVAHYRLGHGDASIRHLHESIEVLRRTTQPEDRDHEGHGGHFYVLAMNCTSIGRQEEAKKWFERGREWDKQHAAALERADGESKRALHDEAAELLGVPQGAVQ